MTILIYSPIACATDLIEICSLSNVDEILEALIFFALSVISTASAYTLFFYHDNFKDIINDLSETVYMNIEHKNSCSIILEHSKKIVTIIRFFWVTTYLWMTTHFIMTLSYVIKEDFTDGKLEIPLLFKTWYPYDKNQSPYYEISFLIETFRMLASVNMILGTESFFVILSVHLADQCFILSTKIENILKDVKEVKRITQAGSSEENCEEDMECDEVLIKDVNHMLEECIMQHISLTK